MKKIEITQKEYKKLKEAQESVLQLTADLKASKIVNKQLNESLKELETERDNIEKSFIKSESLREIFKKESEDLKIELSEVEEVKKQLISKMSDSQKEIKRLLGIEKAYKSMQQSLKSLTAHVK